MQLNSFATNGAVVQGGSSRQDKRVLMRILAVFVVLLVAVVVPASPAGAERSGQATTEQISQVGVAEIVSSSCPFGDWVPATDTTCEDWHILLFREAPAPDLPQQPWILYVMHAIGIVHSDGITYTPVFWQEGFVDNPQGSFDVQNGEYAQVRAIVPMSDGSQLPVDVRWDMSQVPLQHGGSGAIYNIGNGIPRHSSDRCFVLNQLTEQQWRSGPPGQFNGSIGGMDVGSLPPLGPGQPFIAIRTHFVYVGVVHPNCP